MICAGITMYAPLKQEGCKSGKKVGIVGLGGLGHFGVLFAKAFGAEVVVISRSVAKKEDAKQLGAADYLATSEEEGWESGAGRLSQSLHLIISTVPSENMPLSAPKVSRPVHPGWGA